MPLLPIFALALAVSQTPDTWTLKPTNDAATKLSWDVAVDASAEGQQRHATFTMVRSIKSKEGAKIVATYTWEKLTVDDQDGQEVPPWDFLVGAKGEILKTIDPLDDNYRRMLSPLVFVYPDKPVAIDDKWKQEVKPTGSGEKFTYEYQAKQTEVVKDVKTIVISVKITEDGKDGTTGEGTWWVSRVGRVMKFEMKLKNWIVPMAGTDSIDGTIRGQAHI